MKHHQKDYAVTKTCPFVTKIALASNSNRKLRIFAEAFTDPGVTSSKNLVRRISRQRFQEVAYLFFLLKMAA